MPRKNPKAHREQNREAINAKAREYYHKNKIPSPRIVECCEECGIKFPPGTVYPKKYCDPCRIITRKRYLNELARKRYAEGHRSPRNPRKSRQLGYIRPSRTPLEEGNCDICGEFGKLNRDHDNSCCAGLRFCYRCGDCERGELCIKCNTMLAMARDSLQILGEAIKYLAAGLLPYTPWIGSARSNPLKPGSCAICSEYGSLVRDHDNLCCFGERPWNRCGDCERGTICPLCNTVLGMAKDSVKTLQKAIEYLEDYENGKN